MSEPVPLDPDEGPTLWLKTDTDGLMHLLSGTDPENPTDTVTLNCREFTRAGIEAGFIETHIS